jgi:hypothetical protein
MKAHQNRPRIDTTLGELIEAASEVAFEYSKDPNEAYVLTSLVLVEMLKRRFSPAMEDFSDDKERKAGKNHLN